jgi:hypothetical protein
MREWNILAQATRTAIPSLKESQLYQSWFQWEPSTCYCLLHDLQRHPKLPYDI